jgi:phage terminase large subunit-like protein
LFVKWCRQFVVHGEGDLWGQPFVLRPDQELFAFEWFELDPVGSWWHERCYYEGPKGDGKTMLLAALALFELFGPIAPPMPNVPVAAASQDQAMKDGIYGRIVQILEHPNCPLREFAKVGYDVIERLDRPGQIRCLPANGNTTDGGLPTLFVADEVQDWFHTAADAHERNENSTTKRESPIGRSISASTPGEYAGDGSVGWRLHNYGAQVRKRVIDDRRFLFVSHAADEWYLGIDHETEKPRLDDPALLEQALRDANLGASNRRIERLKRRFHEIDRHRFCRFYLGLWMVSDGVRWMDMDAWKRQARPESKPAKSTEIVAFFDGSVNDDATGIVGQTRDGRLFVVGCWEKPEYGPAWRVPRDEVEVAVSEMMADYRVVAFGCDPSGWRSEVMRWIDTYGATVVLEVPPSNERMAPACDQFLSDVIDSKITHDDDPRLFDHVRNAIGKRTIKGTTIRKEGPESPRKIDLAVCAVGANDMRLRFLTRPPEKKKSKALWTRS